MTRLEELYKAINTLRKEGIELDEKLICQTNELEENIIKKEILPMLTQSIEPALKPIQRELVLVVDYVPNQPLSVRLSRKRIISEQIDAKEILPDPQVDHREGSNHTANTKAPKTNIRITFPNGQIIKEHTATDALILFVKIVGAINVRKIGIIRCKFPLISNTIDSKYGSRQKELGGGWYINTNTSTSDKAKDILRISDSLNLDVKVEII
ncbi:MAG: hypothetical protein PHD07_05960 [Bacteroidales bacterium]|nr:hypothetical protein [Bacteroidales bacterium]MDD3200495.1 hypothetical protein [Bacteroidales bacterium]